MREAKREKERSSLIYCNSYYFFFQVTKKKKKIQPDSFRSTDHLSS